MPTSRRLPVLRNARRHVGLTVALAVAIVASAAPAALRALPAAAAPGVHPSVAAALPTDRVHLGLASEPTDLAWMTGSGVPWRYRYAYLCAGVNTGSGWETWQDPALPPGQYAVDYMNASAAAGFIPVFTYYELLQSSPSTGADESARDLSNLTNASTMRAYYANARLLMQRAGAFGRTVVVQVEPDLWGYLEQHAGGASAATIPAVVGSSGDADLAGFPDTAQGFAEALLHLRDRYAPNVVMAVHASLWATGTDVGSDTSPSVDPVAVAGATATFLQSAGLTPNALSSTWDAVFNDIDDHDAGWWEQQGADNAWFTHWWDQTNRAFPNFARYLAWVGELHRRTAVPQVAWQVPLGNQVYLTENNTYGHYQDNVAQYLLGHEADMRAAGLVAVLFGAGNAGQSTNTDAMGDGVTNGSGAPTTDAAGWCLACNTLRSSVADDDGGYIRNAAAAYYRGAPPPSPASAAVAGAEGLDGALWLAGPAGFTSLGGAVAAAPALVVLPGGAVLAIVTGSDGTLWMRTAATPWQRLAPPGTRCLDNPAATLNAGVLIVACQGADRGLWAASEPLAAGLPAMLAGLAPLGGTLAGGPAVAAVGGTVTLYAVGTDGRVWQRTATSGWTADAWRCTGHPGVASAGAAATFACHGGDGALWTARWNGGGWDGAVRAGGTLLDGVAVAQAAAGAVVAVEGTDGSVWTFGPSGWAGLGGRVRGGLGAVATG